MANTTISALPSATTPLAGTEVVPIVQSGVTKKVAVSAIGGGGSGTVTSVSVATANGLAGSVATSTTTPAITLSTTVSGILKGNGASISAATANTDYQSPISLTTAGTSGAATFNGTTLNIPQYTSGGGSGTVTSVAMSVPTFLSVTGSPITSSGTLAVTLSGTALPVANGGTGQTSANAALNGLLPSQSGQSGKVLSTNGTDTSWIATSGTGTVTSVGGTGTVNGITLSGTVTASGNLTLGGTLSGVNLTSQVTGTLPVANGGTGQTTTTAAFDGLAPTQTGNSGKYLTTNGSTTSWATVSGGGSPAGADTQVQYNSGGTSFGASSAFTFTSSTGLVTATGFAGALNGTVGAATPTTGIFTTATARSTAVQDFVALQGRAGGTNSYGVTLTPTTLTGSRTLTLPDATGTILQTGTTVTVGQGGTGATTLTGVLKGNGTSAFSAATSGTDYSAGTSALATGIVKSTTSTGALSIAVAGTDYQAPISLTTSGSSGAATFVGNTLNIPVYTGGGSSGPILESQIVISQNYTLTSNTNGFSVGPVSVATGYAVTVGTGQVWVVSVY